MESRRLPLPEWSEAGNDKEANNMSRILTKDQLSRNLADYYQARFGKRDTDRWYETSAANVKVFARDGELISLKCHILTGEVTETTEKM